ncbi:RNA-directed DNA polymerase [Dyella sp.]|uniref:RNA-directed DNA polymerase n=1 Tax=Dyella sp. TaxID=1869338 RepID=UPI00283C3D7D|nr:RNA-directed DNA polymerase [Dyella sp.]MDR3445944.1 RNA-directed DNA polymerase [Dyella sp.]
MTMPRHHLDRSAGSQARGLASSPSDYAWNVNFNSGNVNYNNRDNHNRALAVCRPAPASEGQGVTYKELYQALVKARRGKVASVNQMRFDYRWMDGLLELQQAINSRTWSPRKTTCFIATRPKTREIHAPDFADRVVHHCIVPKLEAIYEPTFIFDSFANRKRKGSHKAVERLRGFARQVYSGQGGGWYLQLDIRNYFLSLHRPTLYKMLKERMVKHAVPDHVQHVVHALLRHSVAKQGVIHCSTPAERAQVPPHKQLENAGPGCGLPIGNLTSQFFANVYLDKLDQFVKRVLRVDRYVRYVDDFVLVHRDRAQLETWLAQIRTFLRDELKLELKDDIRLRSLSAGIDFLGYVIYPTHTRVRRRVLRHANESLSAWRQNHTHGDQAHATPEDYRRLDSIWASYQGHMRHANAHRLQQRMLDRQPWLKTLTSTKRRFSHKLEGQRITIKVKS